MDDTSIKNICVVGSGAMGSTIAVSFIKAGFNVDFYGRTETGVQRGIGVISSALQHLAEFDFIAPADIGPMMQRLRPTTSKEEAGASADLVIESIDEDLEEKRKIFAEFDRICLNQPILATNTSGLSPTAIAEAVQRKDKFVAMHFWNPAHLMPCVEVVPGVETSRETMEASCQLLHIIGKKPSVLHREALGFVGNRLQYALLREALHIVAEGIASPRAVDEIATNTIGRRLGVIGPLASALLGGPHVFNRIGEYLAPDLNASPEIPALLRDAFSDPPKVSAGLFEGTPQELDALRKARAISLLRQLQEDERPHQAASPHDGASIKPGVLNLRM